MRNPFAVFGPSAGLNNIADPLNLKAEERQKCLDVDIDKYGGEHRRQHGSTLLLSGAYKSVWSNGRICLAVYSGDLVRIDDDFGGHTVLRADVGPNPMCFEDCAGTGIVYYSNNYVIGYILGGVSYTMDSTTVPDRVDTFPGHLIAYFALRLWIAVGNVIWFTDPSPKFYFNSINKSENFIVRKGPIALMKPVEDGLFIADGSTWYMPGTNPKKPIAPMQFICDYDAIPGAVSQYPIDMEIMSEDGSATSGKAIIWESTKGLRYGMKGGLSGNLTRKRFAQPENITRGAVLHRNSDDGFNQLLCTMQSI